MPEYSIPIQRPPIARRIFQARFLHFLTGLLVLLTGLRIFYRMDLLTLAVCLWIFGAAEIVLAIAFNRITRLFPAAGMILRLVAAILFFITAAVDYSFSDPYGAFILTALAFVLSGVLLVEKRMSGSFVVSFHEKGVDVPALQGSRFYPWNRLNAVILHNDLLTLDLSDNKLLQFETAEEWDEIQVGHFNDYCRDHMQKK